MTNEARPVPSVPQERRRAFPRQRPLSVYGLLPSVPLDDRLGAHQGRGREALERGKAAGEAVGAGEAGVGMLGANDDGPGIARARLTIYAVVAAVIAVGVVAWLLI